MSSAATSVQDAPSKYLLTSILNSLRSIRPPEDSVLTGPSQANLLHQGSNPLKNLSRWDHEQARSVLLTLHFLLPHELLPALDLIDRRLITHLHSEIASTPQQPTFSSGPELEEEPKQVRSDQVWDSSSSPSLEVYYVQSASANVASDSHPAQRAVRGRFRNALANPGKSLLYEVHLDSWNCTCPAFAYSALKLLLRSSAPAIHDGSVGQGLPGARGVHEWLMGGVATRDDASIPVCKHILAVALTNAAPGLFGQGVHRREVDREELAGFAAGYGEH